MKKEGQKFTDKEQAEWEQAAVRCSLPKQGFHLVTREELRKEDGRKKNRETS